MSRDRDQDAAGCRSGTDDDQRIGAKSRYGPNKSRTDRPALERKDSIPNFTIFYMMKSALGPIELVPKLEGWRWIGKLHSVRTV